MQWTGEISDIIRVPIWLSIDTVTINVIILFWSVSVDVYVISGVGETSSLLIIDVDDKKFDTTNMIVTVKAGAAPRIP